MTHALRRIPMLLLLPALAAFAPSTLAAASPERHATWPSVSPDGKQILYMRTNGPGSYELRMVGSDGSSDRRVLPLDQGAAVPGWASGGKRAAIVNVGDEYTSLFSINLDGREAKTVVKLRAKGLAVSHSGNRIAFAVGTWRANRLMVGDGKGQKARALTDSSAAWFNIAWSPDDKMLAVSHMDSSGAMQVWLVNPKDGAARALTAFPASDGRPQWPAWSPDGKRIAVQAGKYSREHPEESTSDIWILEVASGKATRITERARPWLDETPSWVDNAHVVIQSTRTGRFELWRLRDDGSEAVQLTR